MKPQMKLLSLLLLTSIAAEASAAGNNPASTDYVDKAIAKAINALLLLATGPTGPTGATGATGATGGQGVQGATGATGGGTFAIGGPANGGVVFYLDSTGQHGLAVACTDSCGKDSGCTWSGDASITSSGMGVVGQAADACQANDQNIGSNAKGIYSGASNTAINIAYMESTLGDNGAAGAYGQACTVTASTLAQQYINPTSHIGGFYLPTPWELSFLSEQYTAVNTGILAYCSGTADLLQNVSPYWSSTQAFGTTSPYLPINAYAVQMSAGSNGILTTPSRSLYGYARAVTAF